MSGPWGLLGIEATADLLKIKKAYAAQLKLNRPDVDADAYQALRQAYEAAQAYARWARDDSAQRSVAQEEDHARLDAESAVELPLASRNVEIEVGDAGAPEDRMPQAAPALPDGDEAPVRPPRALADMLAQGWRHEGVDAAMVAWMRLEAELRRLPLSLHSQASKCFADVMIQSRDWQASPELERAVVQHFGWLSDFRALQALGPFKAQALNARLSEHRPDPAFLDRYRELIAFVQLMQMLRGWRKWLASLIAGSKVRRLWNELGPRQWPAVGVTQEEQRRIAAALARAGWPRLMLVAMFAGACISWRQYAGLGWPARVVACAFFAGVAWVIGGVFLDVVKVLAIGFRHIVLRNPAQGRLHEGLPTSGWLALGGLVAAIGAIFSIEGGAIHQIAGRANDGTMFALAAVAGILAALALALPAWPRTPAMHAAPWIFLLCAVVGMNFHGSSETPWTGALIGILWFLVNALVYSHHRKTIEARWSALLQRKGGGWTLNSAFLVRFGPGWPYTLMIWAGKQSPMPAIAACGLALVALPPEDRTWLVPVWVLFAAAAYGLDLAFASLGVAALRPAPARWKAWAGLGAMTMWALWALVYLCLPTQIDGWLSLPAVDRTGSAWRHLLFVFLLPAVVFTAGLAFVRRIEPT